MTGPRESTAWILPSAVADAPADLLPGDADASPEAATREDWTWLDTFDWRLERAGLRLLEVREDGRRWRELRRREDGRVLRLGEPGGCFADDIEPAALRDRLSPVMEMRALLPVVRLRVQRRLYPVRDARGKIVVRLSVCMATASDPAASDQIYPLAPRIVLEALKGYDDEARRVRDHFDEQTGLTEAETSLMDAGLRAIGREPRDYSSKIRLRLAPSMPAAEATRWILSHLLAALEANETGVREDIDSEFLHDFRVAVRRTRSALGQIKGALPPAPREHFRTEFAWLQQATGPARDLDVYLLNMPDYAACLPEEARADLEPLRAFLERRRDAAYRDLVAELDSDRYRRLLDDWHAFLERDDTGAPRGDWSTRALADQRIRKMYRRLLREGEAIGPESPNEDLHEMRKTCKKLRYLMEFFRSLYPSAEIGRLIKTLKRLQENLGDFHDLHVQREALQSFAQDMTASGEAPPATLLAMGRLVDDLERRERRTRDEFAERFDRFARRKNRRRFKRLFAA
ncbi:MAG: CHAD domain-containing protein [Halofilum sp. (in: g-proteobacteria)]